MKSLQEITNKVFCGDSKEVLREYPDKCVDLVVTSPPYFNLRDYKHSDQIGTEGKVDEYISNLWVIFAECKRILKDTGSIWVNISDKIDYDLAAVPEEFVIMMKHLGLIRRRTIIWHKPSCMPQSDKSSFTVDFEYFYFFVKKHGYQFNTQYEPYKTVEKRPHGIDRMNNGLYDSKYHQYTEYKGQAKKDYESNNVQNPSETKRRILESYRKKKIPFGGTKYPGNVENNSYSGNPWDPNDDGRIKRCVWSINTNNSTDHHFATYPEDLIETPIKACTKEGDLILDPFMGSGTTAIKAQKMGRNYTGVDINEKYVKNINNKLNNMLSTWIRNNVN